MRNPFWSSQSDDPIPHSLPPHPYIMTAPIALAEAATSRHRPAGTSIPNGVTINFAWAPVAYGTRVSKRSANTFSNASALSGEESD